MAVGIVESVSPALLQGLGQALNKSQCGFAVVLPCFAAFSRRISLYENII